MGENFRRTPEPRKKAHPIPDILDTQWVTGKGITRSLWIPPDWTTEAGSTATDIRIASERTFRNGTRDRTTTICKLRLGSTIRPSIPSPFRYERFTSNGFPIRSLTRSCVYLQRQSNI